MQRHLLIKKLQHLNVTPLLIHWINNFLSNRPQTVKIGTTTSSTIITNTVKIGTTTSSTIITNTGTPQGCVVSPFLYTLYTNDCQSSIPNTTYYKYADDTAIVGLLTDNSSITAYYQSITDFALWCSDNYLQLNVDKTKELVIHASKSPPGLTSSYMANQLHRSALLNILVSSLTISLTSMNMSPLYRNAHNRDCMQYAN